MEERGLIPLIILSQKVKGHAKLGPGDTEQSLTVEKGWYAGTVKGRGRRHARSPASGWHLPPESENIDNSRDVKSCLNWI